MMKRVTAIITLIFAMFILVPGAFADETTMQTANTLYANGRYAEAIRAYETLAHQGVDNVALYYNLGNAYYQSGDLGHAILNYRRAEQLAPRNEDVQHNLTLARQQVTDPFSETPDDIANIYLADMEQRFTLNETAFFTLMLWGLVWFMVWMIRRQNNSRQRENGRLRTALKYSLIPTTLLLALAIFTLGSRVQSLQAEPQGVIIAQEAEVYGGPGTQFGSDYQLHSGAEVAIYQTRGDWTQIGVPGSAARGWINAASVESL